MFSKASAKSASSHNGSMQQSLNSDVIDLTFSDSEQETRSTPNSLKRKASGLSSSPIPTKKHENGQSQSSLPIRGTKQRIPEANIRILGRQDTESLVPPARLYANLLVQPQLQIPGFTVSENVRPAVSLDKKGLRKQFKSNLKALDGPKVTLINDIDDSSPPVTFTFINENALGEGVERTPEEFMAGCGCRKDNGRNMGCEFLSCECVQQSDLDEKTGHRHFPYSASQKNYGCLRSVYLKTRRHIYECNAKCNCNMNCKNRVVQHGRQVSLEIFKTESRGWGLRCPVDLQKGQFVDTYRGEVITNDESNRRGKSREEHGDNYLFGLDKFCVSETITKTEFLATCPEKKKWHREQIKNGDYAVTRDSNGEKLWLNPAYSPPAYSIDGMYMGSPTRFINHSCEPNCAIYTVSYNHADTNLYELAFFAMEDIPAGEELTFDYKDNDVEKITDAMADEMEKKNGERPTKCLCGSEGCRGYFFH